MQNRSYKQFEANAFLQEIGQLREKISYTKWKKGFVKTFTKHAPLKTKVSQGNHKPFITKTLRKATMKRSNISNNPEILKSYKNKEIMLLI